MALSGLDALFGALGRLAGVEAELAVMAKDTAAEMADAMRNEIGVLQAGWDPLADPTVAERTRLGYTPDDPLLRSGAMQEAITTWDNGDGSWSAGIPADSDQYDKAKTQEFGGIFPNGAVVPPRPFILPIAQDYGARVADGVSAVVKDAL